MTFSPLQSKLFIPPVRTTLVRRPHLVRRLDHAVAAGCRLALISAMAGAGKTSLLAEWIASAPAGVRFGWLSLDEEDNDPARFWMYLALALGTADKSLGARLAGALDSPQPAPIQLLLSQVLNETIDSPGKLVLILDDYHLIPSRPVHEGMAFLLDHLPPGWLIALATRADPPLPTGRLRARGELVELRAADLRFSPAEAAAFLNDAMGLGLPPEDAQALADRTEGWAAGLQLAALALQSAAPAPSHPNPAVSRRLVQSFSGSHKFLLDYLTQEVLSRQAPEIQHFLVTTSILERLSGELCEAVLENSDLRLEIRKNENQDGPPITNPYSLISNLYSPFSLLESLDRANLFLIPLDLEGQWYRYHHLFADLLQNRLRQQATPAQIAGLHRAAADWFERNGFPDEAVRHAVLAEDLERVARIAEQAAGAGMVHGQVATLLRWFALLPEDLRRPRPRLRLYHAWACFLNGQYDLAGSLLRALEQDLLAAPPAPETRALLGEVYADLATLGAMGGEPAAILRLAEQALDCLPAESLAARSRALVALGSAHGLAGAMDLSNQALSQAAALAERAGNVFLHAHVLEILASNLGHQGRLREAGRTYQRIVDLAEAASAPAVAGIGCIGLAGVSLEMNDIGLAASQIERGLELCRRGGILYPLVDGCQTQALLEKARGNPEKAAGAFRQLQQIYASFGSPAFAVQLASAQARLQLAGAALDRIPHWSAPGREVLLTDLQPEALPVSVREVHWVTLAHLALVQGHPEQVLDLAQQVCATAESGGRTRRLIEIAILKAAALARLSQPRAAAEALARALDLAAPEGYLRLFLDESDSLRPLLLDLRQGKGSSPYLDRLLAAFTSLENIEILPTAAPGLRSSQSATLAPNAHLPRVQVPGSAGVSNPQSAIPVELLSPRELEVLRLVGEGLTNQQIADRLVVSLNTIKKHTSNIYGKLGAVSRTQAVTLARQMGLLKEA
jgi:LuxR family maltose regulon positive regulatory protein